MDIVEVLSTMQELTHQLDTTNKMYTVCGMALTVTSR